MVSHHQRTNPFGKVVGLWNQLTLCDRIWYDVRVMAEAILSIGQNINSDARLIFDVTKSNDVHSMQDNITKAMSTAFESEQAKWNTPKQCKDKKFCLKS